MGMQNILDQAVAALEAALANPQPSYSIDGQSVNHTDYVRSLRETIEWARGQLQAEQPFVKVSRVI